MDTGSIAGLVSSQWHVPDWQTVTIAAAVVIVAFACRAISNRIPGPLIGLVAATIMGQFMDVPEIGPVSLELPVLDLTGLSVQVIAALLVPALSIAVVSFTDVMITSRAFAGGAMPDASSEMCALAAAQFATGVAGGYPMSASSSRTALAYASRSTTRFYSLFVVVVVIAGPLLLPGVIAAVPVAAPGGCDRLRRPDLAAAP